MKKILLLAFALAPVFCFAQGFQVNLEGEKQIGMGHTGTGTLLDGASVFFNPGAVAMLPENDVQAGISPLFFFSEFNPSGTSTTFRNANKIATPLSFYAVWGPKSSRWKLGMGVYTPFGGLTDWGDNWTGKYVLESLNLKTIFFQPTLSIRITDYLSIGAGFVYNHSSIDLTQAIPLSNSNGQDGQGELKGSGKGYGWNAGVYLKTESGVSVGITHRSGVSTTFTGDAIFSVASSLESNFPQPNGFKSIVPLPPTNSLGFGFYPTPKWILALDVNLIGWDVYKALTFTYTVKSPVLGTSSYPRDNNDAMSVRAGAQYQSSDKLFLRFGGGFATSAAGDGFVTPEVPDATRLYLTGGIGYKLANRLSLDASFEFEHLLKRTTTNQFAQLSGTYETNVYVPGISLCYHW